MISFAGHYAFRWLSAQFTCSEIMLILCVNYLPISTMGAEILFGLLGQMGTSPEVAAAHV